MGHFISCCLYIHKQRLYVLISWGIFELYSYSLHWKRGSDMSCWRSRLPSMPFIRFFSRRSYLYLSLSRQYKGKFLNRFSIIFLIKQERDFICSNMFRASRCRFRFIIFLLGRIHIESKVNKLTILIWKFLEMNKTCRNLSEEQMVYTWPAATTRHFIGSPLLSVSANDYS